MTNRADHTCQAHRPKIEASMSLSPLRARSWRRTAWTWSALLAGLAAVNARASEPRPFPAGGPVAPVSHSTAEIDAGSPGFVLPEKVTAAATVVDAPVTTDAATDAEVATAIERLSSGDPDARRDAAARLAWIGPGAQPAVPALIESLADSESVVRAHAAKALWDIARRPEAIPALIELLDVTHPTGRPLASYFLGHIGPAAEQSLPVLHRCLEASDGLERVHLAEAIARIDGDDERAVAALIEGLHNPAPEVRFVAAYALGDVSPQHVQDVVPALSAAQHDTDDAVRTAAGLALQAFRTPTRYTADVIIFEGAAVAALQAPPVPVRETAAQEPPGPAGAAGDASGAGLDPEGGAVGFPEPHCVTGRAIGELTLNIAVPMQGPDGEVQRLPYNHFIECRTDIEGIDHVMGYSRAWMLQPFQWQATAFCRRPLYFEEPNLERLGYSHGFCQPLVSAGHFFGRIPALPYMMHAEPYCESVYTLGEFRPGSCAPYLCHRPPLSVRGAAAQAAVTTALFLAIY